MKTKSFFAALLLLSCATSLCASDIQVDGIWYEFYIYGSDHTAMVTYRGSSYDSYSDEYTGSVVIPSSVTYNGVSYRVTDIGASAFAHCSSMTSVTIPNSVIRIGEHAFFGCTKLTSVTIPSSVRRIEIGVFYYCTNLSSVTLNSNAIVNSDSYKTSNSLRNIFDDQVKEYIIGDSVTSIGYAAFYDCYNLTSITIPNSITEIGENAFWNCSSLTDVHIKDIAAWCNILFWGYDSNPFLYAKHLYLNDSEITDLTIPNSVTSIGPRAFYGCDGLTSVSIPNSVTSIGESAFESCSSMTSITIGNSVASVEEKAFKNCSTLTSVTINSNSIVGKSYYSYPEYSSIKYIFGTQVNEYTIGNDVTEIGDYAFYDCSELTNVTISNSVTSIGSGAFQGCSKLTSVTIPNSVTRIGSRAFYECSGLTSVTIPNSVTDMGGITFYYCIRLTSVIIGNSVTSIGNCAFQGCSKLTSINIPNSVTSIKENAFCGCSRMTSVTIPSSVTSIGRDAFSECYGLSGITNYATTPQIIENGVFYKVNKNNCTLYVPKESLNAYKAANVWKEFYNIVGVDAPEGIESTTIDVQPGTKIIKDGQILIHKGDKTYTTTGQEVR